MPTRSIVGISEAASRLGVHQNTIRKWADDGIIPSLRLPSGHRRFEVDELERFKEAMATRRADGGHKAIDHREPAPGETRNTGHS